MVVDRYGDLADRLRGVAPDGEVVRLGAARGEDDLGGRSPDEGCHLCPRLVDRVAGTPSERVVARGVAELAS
jgi:hypothetical protein